MESPESFVDWRIFGGPPFFEDLHVCPPFGKEHELEDSCWCNPERDSQQPHLIVHNVEH